MSTLTQLQSTIARTQSLLGQAQNISFNVQRFEHAYSIDLWFGRTSASMTTMVANAQPRWQNSVAAFEDSLKVQAGVVGNISTNSTAMTSLVSASQSATGALQAAQAGNQLLALQSQQLSDLVAVLAAKASRGRAGAGARGGTEAQGSQQCKIFSTRSGYSPATSPCSTGN